MTILFHAHSGLRYLVLLAGAVALVLLAIAIVRGRGSGRIEGIATAIFVGLLDLQIVLGLLLLLGGRRPAGIVGHLALMVGAALVAHIGSRGERRRPPGTRPTLALAAVAGALALVALGILAIGRPVVG